MINAGRRMPTRQIVAYVILGILLLMSMEYSHSIAYASFLPYTDDLYVDGSDFSPIVNVISFFGNGIFSLISMAVSVIIQTILSLIAYLIFRFVAIKKNTVVYIEEVILTKKVLRISWIIVFVITVLWSRFHFITAFIFTSIPILFMFLFYYLPIKTLERYPFDDNVIIDVDSE